MVETGFRVVVVAAVVVDNDFLVVDVIFWVWLFEVVLLPYILVFDEIVDEIIEGSVVLLEFLKMVFGFKVVGNLLIRLLTL